MIIADLFVVVVTHLIHRVLSAPQGFGQQAPHGGFSNANGSDQNRFVSQKFSCLTAQTTSCDGEQPLALPAESELKA
jgi:hypothetical protein